MALIEKITQEDLYLYEILKHPVLCGEFINNIDKLSYEEPFEFTEYQKEMLCDFNSYVSFACGRAVGKTVSISNMIVWALINDIFPGDYINYHAPGKNHVEPVFTSLVKLFRSNTLLKHFINRKTGINHSDMHIKCLNGATLMCRIAGQSGTGAAVVGLHSPFVLVDEVGYYPYGTWIELLPTVNSFTSGFKLLASGVPTGLREKNVLYHVDQENSKFSKHRISALDNPRFTEQDDEEAAEAYGGRDSDDYIHLVLGQHGKPIFALFDRNNFSIESYPVYKLSLDGLQLYNNIGEYINHISVLPHFDSKNNLCIFGIDLGYTEPTAIVIWEMNLKGNIRIHSRIKLTKVNYHIQQKIIDWLDSKFNPIVIGIDEGSAGKAVIPTLTDHEEFIHKNFKNKIVPINFSSQISLGIDPEGNEIKSKTKPFSVGLLQEYSNNHKIIYSSTDLELVTELERMTYTKTPTGDIVYRTLTDRGGKKGEDHFTAAMLCGSLAYFMKMESLNLSKTKKKLYQARWNIGVKL